MFDVDAYADKYDVDLYVMEPRFRYDPCIVRVDRLEEGIHIVVYSWTASVRACMEENDWSYADAAEWMSYNDDMWTFDDEEGEE